MIKITEYTRGYNSSADRNRAIAMFRKLGYHYFTCYKDTQSDFALMFQVGTGTWIADAVAKNPNFCHVNR